MRGKFDRPGGGIKPVQWLLSGRAIGIDPPPLVAILILFDYHICLS
jgi:hypothetical protein